MTKHEEVITICELGGTWCSREKITSLYDLVIKSKPKIICEIGCWYGSSFMAMGLAMKDNGSGTIIGIDPWSPDASADGQVEPESEKWWKEQNHEIVYQKFMYTVEKYGVKPFAEIHREKSCDIDPPNNIDILHIDGNHGPDAVKDAERYADNVRLGGYCILDDLRWVGGYVKLAEKHILGIGFSPVKVTDDWGIYQRMEIGKPKVELMEQRKVQSPVQLTVAFVTARRDPRTEWFLESLSNQIPKDELVNVIIVDSNHSAVTLKDSPMHGIRRLLITPPKPTVWQGPSRLTKDDWWAMSNARNTAFCLCETDWIAFCDDRCVLMPGWLDAIKNGMKDKYAVFGAYQKRWNMKVQGGFMVDGGVVKAEDVRLTQAPDGLLPMPPSWAFGCTFALPVEWAMAINGFEELMDGMSYEDTLFGAMLHNNGYRMKYDPGMRIIEDRTPDQTGPAMLRKDKGKSPNDKSHAAIKKFYGLKRTMHPWNLAQIRDSVLSGCPWPDVSGFPSTDWYDQEPIAEELP